MVFQPFHPIPYLSSIIIFAPQLAILTRSRLHLEAIPAAPSPGDIDLLYLDTSLTMANPKEEGSTDPYKITLSHFGDAMKNSPSRRKPVQRVLDLYDKIRRGGNMNQEVQEKFFNDISDIKWATSLKTAVSTHGSYKALKGNGGRHENRRFSNWVIVSACWPDADKLPDIRANMAKYWGLKIFPDGEFPKVAVDKQLTLYLGKLEKKHPSKSKSRTIGSATDPKGKGPQTPNQGGDHGSIDGDSSGGESEDEAIIDEESTTAAQKARDKSLKEEAQKERNSDPTRSKKQVVRVV